LLPGSRRNALNTFLLNQPSPLPIDPGIDLLPAGEHLFHCIRGISVTPPARTSNNKPTMSPARSLFIHSRPK